MALVAAFHDGKIRTRGRCQTYFGHDTLRNLEGYIWDRADVDWQQNRFAIPSNQLGRKSHVLSDVAVYREGIEEWMNTEQKRKRGRRAWGQEAALLAFSALYPDGLPSTPWKTITAAVNNWLRTNKKTPISEDTVIRAANRR